MRVARNSGKVIKIHVKSRENCAKSSSASSSPHISYNARDDFSRIKRLACIASKKFDTACSENKRLKAIHTKFYIHVRSEMFYGYVSSHGKTKFRQCQGLNATSDHIHVLVKSSKRPQCFLLILVLAKDQ